MTTVVQILAGLLAVLYGVLAVSAVKRSTRATNVFCCACWVYVFTVQFFV